jgi:hypothetical protein
MEAIMTQEVSKGAGVKPEVDPAGAEIVPEVTPDQPKVEPTDGDSPPQIDKPSEPAQDAVQKRINKITAEKYEEKRKREELERKIAELENSTKPKEEPKLEDFDYDDDKFSEAKIAYQVSKQLEAQKQNQTQQEVERARQEKAAKFASKEAEYAAAHPSYTDNVKNIPKLHTDTLDAIYEMDNGPAIVDYLGSHLDIVDEIANTSPIMAAVKIGQISTVLKAQTNNKVEPSSAPEPPSTLNAGGGALNESLEDMDMDKFREARRAQR